MGEESKKIQICLFLECVSVCMITTNLKQVGIRMGLIYFENQGKHKSTTLTDYQKPKRREYKNNTKKTHQTTNLKSADGRK